MIDRAKLTDWRERIEEASAHVGGWLEDHQMVSIEGHGFALGQSVELLDRLAAEIREAEIALDRDKPACVGEPDEPA